MNSGPTADKLPHPQYTKLIGYWLPERKKLKLDLDGVARILRCSGVEVREIDLALPLGEQGCFDIIIHKLDSLCSPECGDNEKIETMLKNFADYCEKYDVDILEPLTDRDIFLRDRLAMSHALADICRGLKGVFTPPFVLLPTPSVERNVKLLAENGVTFPCVLKPLDSRLHEMAVAYNPRDMDQFELFPCVAMSFINHDAVLHKIFIIGDEVDVVLRPSIRNLCAGDFPLERFHSARVSKPDADHPLIGPKVTSPPSTPTTVRPPSLDPRIVMAIARRCRDQTDQRLLGIDVVVDSESGRYGVIDMNKFPGYDGVERFAENLAKLLLLMLKEREKRRNGEAEDSGVELSYIFDDGCRKAPK